MNSTDILLPIVVLLVLGCILYFFKSKYNLLKNQVEGFQSQNEINEIKLDLDTHKIVIPEDLYIGFSTQKEADKQKELIKEFMISNPLKLGNIPLENSIFINGSADGSADGLETSPDNITNLITNNICLGEPVIKDDVLDDTKCLNATSLKSFDPNINNIPVFKDNTKIVGYSEADQRIEHDKLCFKETNVKKDANGVRPENSDDEDNSTRYGGTNYYLNNYILKSDSNQKYKDPNFNEIPNNQNGEKCFNENHFKMINGSHGIKMSILNNGRSINYDNDPLTPSQRYEYIRPFSVEYAERPSFSGIVNRNHYMFQRDFDHLRDDFNSSTTCLSDNRKHQILDDNANLGETFFFVPNTDFSVDKQRWSHIHNHISE